MTEAKNCFVGVYYKFACMFHGVRFMLLLSLGLGITDAGAQFKHNNMLGSGYYVVVAAYRAEQYGYVLRYVDHLVNMGMSPGYGTDLKRGYIYVYLGCYARLDESLRAMRRVRERKGFEKAWVRVIRDEPQEERRITGANPTRTEQHQDVVWDQKEMPYDNETRENEVLGKSHVNTQDSVFLSLSVVGSDVPVSGEIELFDADRLHRMGRVKGNSYVVLPDPKNVSGMITLKADVFGYRPEQFTLYPILTFSDTLLPFIGWKEHHYSVQFKLTPYRGGDKHILDRVYFYSDAAIMLPESKLQLHELLSIMNKNPSYTILLHGYTNGRRVGKLITAQPGNSLFDLTGDVVVRMSSAKKLSRARAQAVMNWLRQQGVGEERIRVKAWGGKKMQYDQHGTEAHKNARVELEIEKE